jgi:hypothetical protein
MAIRGVVGSLWLGLGVDTNIAWGPNPKKVFNISALSVGNRSLDMFGTMKRLHVLGFSAKKSRIHYLKTMMLLYSG